MEDKQIIHKELITNLLSALQQISNEMKRLSLLIFLSIILTPAFSQSPQKYSLNDCMQYAVEHNTGVKQQVYSNDNNQQDATEAFSSLLPSISGSVGASTNYGRSIDPETNIYNTTANFNNSYSLSTSMPLFAGLTNVNVYRAARVMKLMGVEQFQQAKDEVAMNTMKAFFDAVYYSNSSQIAKEQMETSKLTLARSEKQRDLGLKSDADVAQVEAQVASNELLFIQQQNQYELAILQLKDKMNYPIDEELLIDTEVLVEVAEVNDNVSEIIGYAMTNNPKVLASSYNVKKSKIEYHAALGNLFPSIYIGGGYSTNYFQNLDNNASTKAFKDQFKDNRGTYVGASVNIPIFDAWHRKTNVKRYKNYLGIAEQKDEEVKRALNNEIAQTSMEMQGYGKEFASASKKEEAADLAHKASISKYEQGLVGPIDLQTTANQLLDAKSQKLNARLQYIIRQQFLGYYKGEPLVK